MMKLSLLIGLFSTVLLSSSLAHAWLTVSPGFVNFGQVKVGSNSHTSTIFVINNSNETKDVGVFGYCADFVVDDYCYTLRPYSSCAIIAQMQPRTEGTKSCIINIRARGDFATASLSGTAVKADE